MVVGRAPVELEPVDLGGVVDGCDGPVGGEVRGRTAARRTGRMNLLLVYQDGRAQTGRQETTEGKQDNHPL